MSVREYIGARYVPVFADPIEWDATSTYEALTVVTYQGNSYTSRQAVPANIPITNTTYWAQTGNYNAQVEQYRQEVETFDGRIDELEDTVSPYTSSNTIQSAISTAINNEASARSSADTSLGNRITTLETKPLMVVIGDSWSNPDSTVKWPTHVARCLGLTLHNYARGGVGYSRNKTNCFYDQLTQAGNELDATNVAKVYIFGGLNDVYTADLQYSAFTSAVQATLGRAKTLFPNSEIIVAGVQRYQNGNIAYNTTPLNFFKIELFTTILSDTCADIGCTFISLQNFGINGNNIYNSDGHPNEKGYRSIASKMLYGQYSHNENINIAEIGRPRLIYSDDSYSVGWVANPNCINKGGNLFNIAVGFNIDHDKLVAGAAYIDFRGYPHPGTWASLLGVQTGTIITINPSDYYNLGSSVYGNIGYCSTFTVPYSRANFANNTLCTLSYDFEV